LSACSTTCRFQKGCARKSVPSSSAFYSGCAPFRARGGRWRSAFSPPPIALLVARGFQLELTVVQAVLLLAALGLSSAAPSTPGYIGIYQFVAVTVLAPFGYTQDQALVFILAFQALSYLLVLIFGLVGLWRLNRGGAGVDEPIPLET
jgi:hypothetical protein